MIHYKEKLHAIGNYLHDRFDFTWEFLDANVAHPDIILISEINVKVHYFAPTRKWVVTYDNSYQKFDTPMQVINYIITRKYEVK